MKKSWAALTVLTLALAAGVSAEGKGGHHEERGMAGKWHGEGHGHPMREEGMERFPMSPRFLKELKMTPEQEKKFKEMHVAARKRKIQIRSEQALLEVDLRALLSTYPVKQAEAMKIGEKIADLERKAALFRVETWSQFLTGLTEEQHDKLMDLHAEFHQRSR